MPYIDKDKRSSIYREMGWDAGEPDYNHIDIEEITCAGDIQYAIAIIIKAYMRRHGLNYQNCNDVMGALAGAQQEFYRKTVAPYEEMKEEINGPI